MRRRQHVSGQTERNMNCRNVFNSVECIYLYSGEFDHKSRQNVSTSCRSEVSEVFLTSFIAFKMLF